MSLPPLFPIITNRLQGNSSTKMYFISDRRVCAFMNKGQQQKGVTEEKRERERERERNWAVCMTEPFMV